VSPPPRPAAGDTLSRSDGAVAGRTAIYRCRLRHVRAAPVRHSFTHRTWMWLVDIDALPSLPGPVRWLARFEARDHLGDPHATLRQNVDRFLAAHGIDLAGGRVLMLTHARSAGQVFNPLTVYWCHDGAGALACVLAEVHNTYSERHCYLLRTDGRGRAATAKEFYVSPFCKVEGHYQMSLPEPGERLALTVTLHPPGGPPFAAQLRGVRRSGTWQGLLRAWLRRPCPALTGLLLIRGHGIWLYVRGLPVVRRPDRRRSRAGATWLARRPGGRLSVTTAGRSWPSCRQARYGGR
jgi:uncharacterized protein